jgi:predicted O-methyltransferase YrrM
VVVTDNKLEPPFVRMAANLYRGHVREREGFDTVLLPFGSGLAISRYRGG